MSAIIHYIGLRTLNRRSGEKHRVPREDRYDDVELRIVPGLSTGEVERAHDQALGALRRAGSFRATRHFRSDWARSGKWQRVRVPLKPRGMQKLLQQLDIECELGFIEVRVSGIVMGRSHQVISRLKVRRQS